MILPTKLFTKSGKINSNYIISDNFLKSIEYKEILDKTLYLKEVKISERIYCIKNSIREIQLCSGCKKKLTFKTFTTGYSKSCSSEQCKRQIYHWNTNSKTKKENREKIISTFIKRYKTNDFKIINVNKFINNRIQVTELGRKHTFINDKHYKNNIDELCTILYMTKDYIKELSNLKWSERLYLIKNNFNIIKCKFCDKKTPYISFTKGYQQTCSFKCGVNLSGEHRIETHFKKYVLPNLNKQKFELTEEYKGLNDSRINIKCKICSNIINIDLSDGKHNNIVCYKCHRKNHPLSSKEETIFLDFIKSIYKGKIITQYRLEKGQTSKTLDIYLPEKQLGLEYNGIYYHSYDIKVPIEIKQKHLNKTKLCEQQNILLMHILSTEWLEKRDIWESMIKYKLGIYKKRYYARKCNIKQISNIEKNIFLNENHIQGTDLSTIKLGLFNESKLVSVMTFGKPRFNKKYQWELLRFCNKKNYVIVGSASKLLKYFERKIKPHNIITYADRSRSNGNLYYKLNFNKINETQISYFYYKYNKIVSRMQAQKHKLTKLLDNFNDRLTEEENMFNNKYRKVYNCGNFVFTKIYK